MQLLEQQDFAVAAWTWNAFKLTPMYINRAFGILEDSELVGAIIFTNYNGANVEISYYAENVISAGIVRAMCRFVLEAFRIERVTFKIRQPNLRLRRHLKRFGAKCEGKLERYYGPDAPALQYVIFKEQLIKIAGPRYMRAKLH